jgi:hypothetical protein
MLFTRLFGFNCLSAQLKDVQSYRVFNAFSFFGVLHEGLTIYIIVNLLQTLTFSDNKNIYLAAVDCLVVTAICFILSLLSSQK